MCLSPQADENFQPMKRLPEWQMRQSKYKKKESAG